MMRTMVIHFPDRYGYRTISDHLYLVQHPSLNPPSSHPRNQVLYDSVVVWGDDARIIPYSTIIVLVGIITTFMGKVSSRGRETLRQRR